jgi:hypothetical protein
VTPTTAAAIWLFYALLPGGILPVPNSPAFSDLAACQRALERADPFLPGKTACWPAPYKYEDSAGAGIMPKAPDEHVD